MRHSSPFIRSNAIYTISVIGFIATIHLVLPVYSNSSFLSTFVSERSVGIIYMLASAATIIGLIITPLVLRKLGNYSTTLWLIVMQMILFYGIITTNSPTLVSIYFILQTAVIALISFCLDIFLEIYSETSRVGVIRGMYLTTLNSAWIIAPLIGSMIIGSGNDYKSVYIASFFMLFPLFYLVYRNFPRFRDPHYKHASLLGTMSHIIKDGDQARLFSINIILQVFYAWMVVYSPIYLHTVIGLNWAQIGIIITVMLLPFPIVEWPLGRLADKKYGEKEIMIIGFALMGLATMALATITTSNVIIWALALFITRVGAASAEVMIETYFFKTVNVKDPSSLGIFRVTRSISYFIAPLVTWIGFLFSKDQSFLFVVLGIICLFALLPAWSLKDTN